VEARTARERRKRSKPVRCMIRIKKRSKPERCCFGIKKPVRCWFSGKKRPKPEGAAVGSRQVLSCEQEGEKFKLKGNFLILNPSFTLPGSLLEPDPRLGFRSRVAGFRR
jgi:hypothetical protein